MKKKRKKKKVNPLLHQVTDQCYQYSLTMVSMFYESFLKTLLKRSNFFTALSTTEFLLSIYYMKEGMHAST